MTTNTKNIPPFRHLIPSESNPHPRLDLNNIDKHDAYTWSDQATKMEDVKIGMVGRWTRNNSKPFYGVTSDGNKIPNLYKLEKEKDCGAPVETMYEAAQVFLSTATPEQKEKCMWPVDSDTWRMWANPEIYINKFGIRLEEVSKPVQESVFNMFKASLSDYGYKKLLGCMRMNEFLGEIVNARGIMNLYSYNFNLFGKPSLNEPWGFHIYGHHLCMNVFVVGRQLVITPIFMGAEPDVIDQGPHSGLRLFDYQEECGLKLMKSLDASQQDIARIYKSNQPEDLPQDLWNPFDERHLAGASQDNRIIPYQGFNFEKANQDQKDLVIETIGSFLNYLPDKAFKVKMDSVKQHIQSTWLTWYGGFSDTDTFYYRIQSPVIMVEFDYHKGIWLTNTEPAKCHIHTTIRTPNGNDYGKELVCQFYQNQNH